MNYEKKYKEALERAKRLHSEPTGGTERIVCEQIFPELRESEDEKIRKELIGFLRNIPNSNYTCEEMALWLEKQGTQPRFNIGDVICDKSCTTLNKEAQPNMEIVDIKNGMYICDKGSFPVSQQDEYVLVSKKIDSKLNDCSVSNELRAASFAHAKKEILNHTFPNNEEFELVYTFEEGAKWDADKKELKKIVAPKFKVGDTMRTLQEASNGITSGLPVIVSIDNEYYHCNNELIAIKNQDNYEYPPMNRRQKPAWSNKDKKILDELITFFEKMVLPKDHDFRIYASWLKSLKDRCTWKPSDEQMDALQYVCRNLNPPLSDKLGWDSLKTLELLYQDLKKL